MVSLRQIQKKKKIWYLGIFLIYSSLLELLIHFTGEDIHTYNLVFVVTLRPFFIDVLFIEALFGKTAMQNKIRICENWSR